STIKILGLSLGLALATRTMADTTQTTANELTAIKTTLQSIAGKLPVAEQSLSNILAKAAEVSDAFSAGGDPRSLDRQALDLLSQNDQIAVELATFAAQLKSAPTQLVKLQQIASGGTGTNNPVLQTIRTLLAQAAVLSTQTKTDAQTASNQHVKIKLLVIQIE